LERQTHGHESVGAPENKPGHNGAKVSIMSRRGGALIKISLHRAECSGSFTSDEIGWVRDSAELLFALVGRHQRLMVPQGEPVDPATYVECILSIAPELSGREAEVCAGIAMGRTNEGIGLDLGISPNTVRTYRKRAYAQLSISSHNELLKLILATPEISASQH
jgi:DNA-binding CsgD family transcriptional regulator